MELIRYESLPAMPWRNGGGVTREIAALAGDLDAGFLWRVSIATVSASGPFSIFPDVDRTIAVIDGAGLVLQMEGDTVTLTRSSAPYPFDGAQPIEATNIDGETIDLNVMTRRGQFRHSMTRITLDQPKTCTGKADETILVFNGDLAVSTNGSTQVAHQRDALVGIKPNDTLELIPNVPTELLVIEIWHDQ